MASTCPPATPTPATITTLVATVDTRRVAGVPCLIVPPRLAKRCLALLRTSGWHPAHHSRLVLDRRPGKPATSPRAYQVRHSLPLLHSTSASPRSVCPVPALSQLSDEAAVQLADGLQQEEDGEGGSLLRSPEALKLLQMVRSGEITWRPTFQLHDYIIDEARCDCGEICGADEPALSTIRYHPAHALKRSGRPAEPEPEPEPASEPLAQPDPEPPKRGSFLFAELFAGIGGFRVGLEACGGRCVFSSEINPWAKSIYALNFAQQGGGSAAPAEVVADSIQSVDAASVPYYDLLTAGFPCQPFTGTATGKLDDEGDGEWMEQRPRGFRDPRGQLFWHTIRLVRCHKADPQRQPKAILLENVPGLLKNDCTAPSGDTKDDDAAAAAGSDDETKSEGPEEAGRGGGGGGDGDPSVLLCSALPTVLAALTECGYHVTWKQYDASRLVPQARLRIYIVAIRNDLVTSSSPSSSSSSSSTTAVGSSSSGPLAEFRWPELPELNPKIGSILHTNNDDEEDLESFRLTPRQWERVGDRIERGSSNYLFNTRVADPAGVSNTIRASYRSVRAGNVFFCAMLFRVHSQTNPNILLPRQAWNKYIIG